MCRIKLHIQCENERRSEKMAYRTQETNRVKELLVQLDGLLSEHIEVFNSIFNPPLRAKIPIPFIMKKVDFLKLYKKSQSITKDLEVCLKKSLVMRDYGIINNDNHQVISNYGECFLLSSSKLSGIAYELYLKAERKNNLSYGDYKEMVEEYKKNEEVRLSYGDEMNELVKEYF